MNREEVKELFQLIGSVYPMFIPDNKEQLTQKVNTWTRLMRNMDFERVMAKAEDHVQTNKYPPTIAEISAFAPEKNETLEKMKQWKREADQVPESVKEEFRQKLQQLMKEKS